MYIFQSPKQPTNQATNQPPSQPTNPKFYPMESGVHQPTTIYRDFEQQTQTVCRNKCVGTSNKDCCHPKKKHGDSSDRTKSLDIIWLFNIAMTNDP